MPSAVMEVSATYELTVHTEPEGGYWAEVVTLPGCFTQADTLDELLHNAKEAIGAHLDVDVSDVRISNIELAI